MENTEEELLHTLDEEDLAEEVVAEQEAAHDVDIPASLPIEIAIEDLPALMEAMVFASPEPLTRNKVQEVFERKGVMIGKADIDAALHAMAERWNDSERTVATGIELAHVAGGYVFRTRGDFGPILRGLVEEKPARLSQAQLEVLAIVSYRQPITRMEVEEVRGVDCSASMRRLLNLKLIKILGKSEGLGRPLLYGTTKHFLEFFGLNSLHDLPTLKDYQDLDKGEEKEQDDLSDAAVTVRDLFAAADTSMFSESTEQLSVEALKSLDVALGVIEQTTKQVNVDEILGNDTKHPGEKPV